MYISVYLHTYIFDYICSIYIHLPTRYQEYQRFGYVESSNYQLLLTPATLIRKRYKHSNTLPPPTPPPALKLKNSRVMTPRDSQGHGSPIMVSLPYYSHIFRDSKMGVGLGNRMGPKGSHILRGSLKIPTDYVMFLGEP